MKLWFWLALLSSAIWASNNHLDKYLISRYYQVRRPDGSKLLPWTPIVLVGVIGAFSAMGIAIFNRSALNVPISAALVMMLAGSFYFMALVPYFKVLADEEASRVVPLFQVQPVFSLSLGFLFLNERLKTVQILAGLLIIAGAVALELDLDNKGKFKKKAFFLMFASTALFSLEAFLFKFISIEVGFWSAALYQYLGAALAAQGLFWFSRKMRSDFWLVIKSNGKPVLGWSALNESLYLGARMIFNYATTLAPLGLVTFVNGFQPIFVIFYGISITIFLPHISKENISAKHLAQKIGSVVIIIIGTYLLLI